MAHDTSGESGTPETDKVYLSVHKPWTKTFNRLLQVSESLERRLTAARAEAEALRKDAERYRWLANRVLACDYGDNDKPGEIGWRIRHDLLPAAIGERQPAFMYGKSIDAAIDAALTASEARNG